MDFYQVLEAFMELSGLSELESMRYGNMLRLTTKHVEKRIRPDVDLELNEHVLVQFAASIAYYAYATLQSQKASTVSALDVRVDVDWKQQVKAASDLKNQMLLLASDMLVDNGFLFSTM